MADEPQEKEERGAVSPTDVAAAPDDTINADVAEPQSRWIVALVRREPIALGMLVVATLAFVLDASLKLERHKLVALTVGPTIGQSGGTTMTSSVVLLNDGNLPELVLRLGLRFSKELRQTGTSRSARSGLYSVEWATRDSLRPFVVRPGEMVAAHFAIPESLGTAMWARDNDAIRTSSFFVWTMVEVRSKGGTVRRSYINQGSVHVDPVSGRPMGARPAGIDVDVLNGWRTGRFKTWEFIVPEGVEE